MKELIEQAFDDRTLLERAEYREAVLEAVRQLDCGQLRVANQEDNGEWRVNS